MTLSAFAISLAFGIPFGTLAARFAGTFLDTAITVLALIFYATPLFWIALIAILLFSVWVAWLPSFGYETVGANYAWRVDDRAGGHAMPFCPLSRARMLALWSSGLTVRFGYPSLSTVVVDILPSGGIRCNAEPRDS